MWTLLDSSWVMLDSSWVMLDSSWVICFLYLLTPYKWLEGKMIANFAEQKIIAVLGEIVATYCLKDTL